MSAYTKYTKYISKIRELRRNQMKGGNGNGSDDDENLCPICMTEFISPVVYNPTEEEMRNPSEQLLICSRSHRFCLSCFVRYVEGIGADPSMWRGAQCPLCRTSFSIRGRDDYYRIDEEFWRTELNSAPVICPVQHALDQVFATCQQYEVHFNEDHRQQILNDIWGNAEARNAQQREDQIARDRRLARELGGPLPVAQRPQRVLQPVVRRPQRTEQDIINEIRQRRHEQLERHRVARQDVVRPVAEAQLSQYDPSRQRHSESRVDRARAMRRRIEQRLSQENITTVHPDYAQRRDEIYRQVRAEAQEQQRQQQSQGSAPLVPYGANRPLSDAERVQFDQANLERASRQRDLARRRQEVGRTFDRANREIGQIADRIINELRQLRLRMQSNGSNINDIEGELNDLERSLIDEEVRRENPDQGSLDSFRQTLKEKIKHKLTGTNIRVSIVVDGIVIKLRRNDREKTKNRSTIDTRVMTNELVQEATRQMAELTDPSATLEQMEAYARELSRLIGELMRG